MLFSKVFIEYCVQFGLNLQYVLQTPHTVAILG